MKMFFPLIAGLAACGAMSVASANLVTNGSFEIGDNADGSWSHGNGNGTWDTYERIRGWTAVGEGAAIEIQTGQPYPSVDSPYYTPKAPNGDSLAELDAHNDSANSGMKSDDINVTGGTYKLSFQYTGRTENAETNRIDYGYIFGNDTLLQDQWTISGTVSEGWQLITQTFTLDSADTLNLTFFALGDDDTLGGFIDDVKLTAVPIPAALPLFMSALAGLGFVGFRRRKA
ncbi:hypothetical protein [Thiorhodovibrio frisius]|uniref:PEP-CTERM exosortase interaction domain-containing protein n=1 Tax=Thiorhodovibrio frisius TaxID=631362 RepID=H8YYA8_9GAMM|nr:hypothetical protein [Thiorhodovibrio frisius]EIC23434.1 hypothetical protein Thi970DRAFT_01099 [Thiorhodovibrio frisius]WPL23485.1 hypothetical protein Thiofri_03673 [Thiorhodovibrio frisius]